MLFMPYLSRVLHVVHALRMLPLNQELQQVFIDKHLQGTTLIPTLKE
jgi:hypothetical protein